MAIQRDVASGSQRSWPEQCVSYPDHSEDLVTVYGVVQVHTQGLPEDAKVEGFVYDPQHTSLTGVFTDETPKIAMFYSESWRTWYPIADFVKGA